MTANVASRNTAKARQVPEVEALPCPNEPAGGNHLLVADRAARVACVWCLGKWADLDAAVRRSP